MQNQKDERVIPGQIIKNYFRKGVKAKGVRRVFQTLINIKEHHVLSQNKISSAERKLANQLIQKKRMEYAKRNVQEKHTKIKVSSQVSPISDSEEAEQRGVRDYRKLIFLFNLKTKSQAEIKFKAKSSVKGIHKDKLGTSEIKFNSKKNNYILKFSKINNNNKIRPKTKIRLFKRFKYKVRFKNKVKKVNKFRCKIAKPFLIKLTVLASKLKLQKFRKKFQKKFKILKERGSFSTWFLKQAITNCRWRVFLRSRWVAGKRMKVPFFTTLLRDTRYACKNFIKSIIDRGQNPFLPGLLKELYFSLILKSITVKKRVLAYRTLYATSLYTGSGYKTVKRRKRINRY